MTEANSYHLQGAKSKIVYEIDITGRFNSIVLNGKVFEGVTQENTEAGPMASVLLEQVADSHVKKLSLLVPPVNLKADKEPVSTYAIVSTHHTTLAGPTGQVITYEVEPLKGHAQLIVN